MKTCLNNTFCSSERNEMLDNAKFINNLYITFDIKYDFLKESVAQTQ